MQFQTLKRFFLTLSCLAVVFTSQAQLIRQPVTNFTPREYGQNVAAYTYSVAECNNGLIYVGTAFQILQFDGVSWRYINVREGAAVTSVVAHKGTVYLGCHGDFGLLRPDDLGKLYYHSLGEKLPEEELGFSAIKEVLILNDTIVFQAEEKIFLYHNDSITIEKPRTSFHHAFICNNTLYVRERQSGILKFDGTEFKTVEGSEVFSDFGVFSILPFSENSKLIITLELGLWEWNANGFSQLSLGKDLQNLIYEAEIIGGVLLDDGNYALYSLKGGVLIIDPNLNLIANYTIATGLLSSEIQDLAQDRHGNIWVATQKGASRIQYTSQFSIFNQSVGLFGSIQAVTKLRGRYLVGTTEGFFINEPEGLKVFSQQTEVSGGVWAIEDTPNGVWIATNNGLWLYNGINFFQVNHFNTSALKYISERGWLVASGLSGFYIVDEASKEIIVRLSEIRTDAYGIAYKEFADNQITEIWVGSRTSGVWQLSLRSPQDFSYNFFNIEDGLPPDWVCAYQAGNDVLFATSLNGMLRFVTPQEFHALLNDETIDANDLMGFFDIVDFPKNSNDKAVTAFYFDEQMSYAVLDYHVNEIPMHDSIPSDYNFKTLELGRLNAINMADGELMVGGDDGLAIVKRIDTKERVYPVPDLMIRSVTIGTDSLVWYGDITLKDRTIVVPYALNSIEIELASTYFDNGFTATYSWRIKGADETYTRWSPQSTVSLTNLREGEYEILMVAKNIHDDLSNEQALIIKVLPPWYRTWWAYALYFLVAAIIVYGLIQFNIRRLKEQNKRLEEIVKARTKEVVEQKEHIEHILQDIQSSISYAQRIQQALLPSGEILKEFFPNHFIVFHPRDVVSGDFYWTTQVDDWVIITAADCTGHGVPGAFMSMLGISFLNEIVRKKEVVNTAMILNQLREAVVEALKQTGKQDEQKDGMDMSIIAINTKTNQCYWSGANNPLYILRQGAAPENHDTLASNKRKVHCYETCHLVEIKGDKMPVAIHTIMENYTNHEVELKKGDRAYLFSDGFADQFGGSDYRKFMTKKFKELLAKTYPLPIDVQGQEVDKAFVAWKNYDGNEYEQIDDVTILGIEI